MVRIQATNLNQSLGWGQIQAKKINWESEVSSENVAFFGGKPKEPKYQTDFFVFIPLLLCVSAPVLS